MTAAVMSNYFYNPSASGWRPVANGVANANGGVQMQNWMMAQMAQYPPPQQHGQHHYNAMYQADGAAQPILDSHSQLQYSDLGQVIYPKVSDASINGQPASAHQVHDLTHQLHHHGYEEQQLNQPMQPVPQTIHSQQPLTVQTSQSLAQEIPDQPQKVNRLRKACDSCSIRKVRVSFVQHEPSVGPSTVLTSILSSVTKVVHHVELAQLSTSLAPLIDLVVVEVHPTDTQRASSVDGSKRVTTLLAS